ncbi:MAG: hypothetical protein ACFFD6_11665, partial [Candidatus Thorarchaeota archaeon]
MIDDDEFQKIFRRMIEQFFGTFGMQPGGSGVDKMWETPIDDRSPEMNLELEDVSPKVERIDLEDAVLLPGDEASGNRREPEHDEEEETWQNHGVEPGTTSDVAYQRSCVL